MSFSTNSQAENSQAILPKNERKSKNRKLGKKDFSLFRRCRFEELEKREMLAADPISVGVVYSEQIKELEGDNFYIAWVGGDSSTLLSEVTINLDKNGNGQLDENEGFYDTQEGGLGVYSSAPFKVNQELTTEDIRYNVSVNDGGMSLVVQFENFHAGDSFVFSIDVDEYYEGDNGDRSALVEGAEFGISGDAVYGSSVTGLFTSSRNGVGSLTWNGEFYDVYADEDRPNALVDAYDSEHLPYDTDDDNEGIQTAGAILEYEPILISGYVYHDLDVDCNYDVGEDVPIENVSVTLVQGSTLLEVQTDASGYYEFSVFDPGDYTVLCQSHVEIPINDTYYTSYDFCAKGGEFAEKVDPITIDINDIQSGNQSHNNNFSKVLPGKIDGYVFEDLNNKDNKESGEEWDGDAYPVRVELYMVKEENGTVTKTFVESQIVDEDGYYCFDIDGTYNETGIRKNVNRWYEVREIQETVTDDYSDGKDYIGSVGGDNSVKNTFGDIYIGYNTEGYVENGYNYNFGELKLGSIAGNVFEDYNDNGFFDDNEKGIASVTVELYRHDGSGYALIDSMKTESDGAYEFTNLDIIGDYAVKVRHDDATLVEEGYTNGKDHIGSVDEETVGIWTEDSVYSALSQIVIGWDNHGITYDFGELKLGSIAGNVFEDFYDDGEFGSEDDGIESVTVDLYRWNGMDYEWIDAQKTETDGAYRFDDLAINQEYAVKVRYDDPILTENEYIDGKEHVGTLDGESGEDQECSYITNIDVGWDEHGYRYDFGELKEGSVTGSVYHDANENGQRDSDEDGIANVTMTLYCWNDTTSKYESVTTTTTDADGYYWFMGLKANETYAVGETQPEGWTDGDDTIGSLGGVAEGDFTSGINVVWTRNHKADAERNGVQYDFGELLNGSISGYVYEDNNDNGIKEAGEAGIAKVTVTLYSVESDGSLTKVGTRKTDSDGYYEFEDVEVRKTFVLKETHPTEYFDGKDTEGTINGETVGKAGNDEITDILMPDSGVGINYNFGELKPAELSGYVYEDLNDNGIKEPGEAGISNVTLTLWVYDEEAETYVLADRVTTTNSEGYYQFKKLEPKLTYRIVEAQPSGYNDGKDTAGTIKGQTVGTAGNDEIFDIDVTMGDSGINYNFGELVPDDPPDNPGYNPPRSIPVTVPTRYIGGSPNNFNYFITPPSPQAGSIRLFGGGGLPTTYTWHLSVLDGGYPRSIDALGSVAGYRGLYMDETEMMMNVSWSADDMNYGQWLIRADDGSVGTSYILGLSGATPVVGDWDGDGTDSIGLFVDGNWFLDRNGDGAWDLNDLWAELGKNTDQAVYGDWDGDGKTDIGVFGPKWSGDANAISTEPGLPADLNRMVNVSRPKNIPPEFNGDAVTGHRSLKHRNNGQLRVDLIDHVFEYGNQGDVAITGDWNGDGVSKIGVFRGGEWFLDINGNGRWDQGDMHIAQFGQSGDIPIVSDFNSDGISEIGLFRDGKWMLDTNGDYDIDRQFDFGQAGDRPVVGDFNGDGTVEFGVYRSYTPEQENIEAQNTTDSPENVQVAQAPETTAVH